MKATAAYRDSFAGVNIGGTSTTVVRGDVSGRILSKATLVTDRTQTALDFYRAIARAIRGVTGDPAAIGVAVGGPLDARNGIVLAAPHLPHLAGFPLAQTLRDEFSVPVRVHHDAAACALAEYRWGVHAGVPGLAYLTCGTGFGAGIVLDGRPRYGSSGLSPELGHVRFRDDGPDIFGKRGAYEGYGSATALALLARDRVPHRFGNARPREVASAARAGDPDAVAVVRENERAVGAACALLADLLALDAIVLGSLAQYLGEAWFAAVDAEYRREALPLLAQRCTLARAMPEIQDRSAIAAAHDAWNEAHLDGAALIAGTVKP